MNILKLFEHPQHNADLRDSAGDRKVSDQLRHLNSAGYKAPGPVPAYQDRWSIH